MVEGLLNFATIITRGAFRGPEPYEIDKIAKPAATLLARRPQVQNAVKKFSAPVVLIAAIGGYFIVRVAEIQGGAARKPPQQLRVVPPPPQTQPQQPVSQAATSPANEQPQPSSDVSPAMREQAAAAADNLVAQLRYKVPGG